MYFGIVPAVYQSAGKLRTGKITKRGSKHMRRILVQVAKAISKTKKSSRLKRFFLRVLTRGGKKNVAAIALARKVLCNIEEMRVIIPSCFPDVFDMKELLRFLAGRYS